ncbi:MAG: hypothetical protein LBQ75_09420 [Zoogloeaceae bacterium]|nr:hypothetical protein [Zoogloeaceae bacterium]
MTIVTVRMPVDMIESMKRIAPLRGFSGYQPLLKHYVSEGLRKDEAEFIFSASGRLIDALKKQGISEKALEEAAKEAGISA